MQPDSLAQDPPEDRAPTPAPAVEKVPSRDIRRSTIIGWAAGIVAVYDFILFGTLLPRIAGTFGWSESHALLISTLVSVGTAIVLGGTTVSRPAPHRISRRGGGRRRRSASWAR